MNKHPSISQWYTHDDVQESVQNHSRSIPTKEDVIRKTAIDSSNIHTNVSIDSQCGGQSVDKAGSDEQRLSDGC